MQYIRRARGWIWRDSWTCSWWWTFINRDCSSRRRVECLGWRLKIEEVRCLVEDTKEENKDDVQLLKNIPTDEYLKDLKSLEDLDFKIRNLDKFHKKMQKISGNLPLEEMFLDVAGTSTQLSNLHITDMNRLNNLNINSPSFH